jgi:hypothetical protein
VQRKGEPMLRNALLLTGLAALVCLGMLIGCSDDGGPKPVRFVSLTVDSTGVEICATLEIAAQVAGGESRTLDWYVNGVLGGTSETGTISQVNPATYNAPDSIPPEATVTIKAVSSENPNRSDSCRVTVKFTVLHVSGATGNDVTATGCVTKPFKTITQALSEANSGQTVLAAPGIYDAANGEVFPLEIEDGISLVGEDWTNTIIRGHSGTASYEASTYLFGHHPALRRLTVEMGEPADTSWSIAIYVPITTVGALVDSVRVNEPADYSVLRVEGADSTTVSNCSFVVTDGEHEGRGFEICSSDAGTVVRDCTVSGFHTGLFVNDFSDVLVEGCLLHGNDRGVQICCFHYPTSDPDPDLGGGARGSAGGNIIQDNSVYGLYHSGTKTIYAKYNTWNNDPPTFGATAGSDIYVEDAAGGGEVTWE